MKNFQPGGLRNRKPDLGGRPASDAGNYAPKKRFDGGKPSFGSKPGYGNKPSFGGDRDKKDVTLYNATCTTCGKSCEVPFRPDGKKPVLCRDCFAAKNESPTNMSAHRDRFTPNEMVGRKFEQPASPRTVLSPDYQLLVKQLGVVEDKVNQILALIKASEQLVAALPVVGQKPVTIEGVEPDEVLATPTKLRKPKKVTPAIKKAAAKKKVAKKAAVAKKVAKKATK
jgi:CxxC-x17-CxxC domain-containing protein